MSAREGLSRYLSADKDKDKPRLAEGSGLARYLPPPARRDDADDDER